MVNDLKTNPITVRMEVDVPQLSYNSVGATYYNPRLDLSKITAAGPQTLKITTTSTSTYGTVTELTPDTVQVEVEEYITRYRIPVTIEQKGEIPEGYYLDDLKLDPSLVAVSGPKSLVNQVRRAVAELDLSQLAPKEGGYAEAIPFKLLDAQGEEIVSDLISVTSESVLLDSVVVEYDLYPLQQISLSTLGLTKGEPAEGYEVKSVAVTPSIIQAAGPAEVLELLDLKALFLEQIDHIEVNAKMILTYVFKDGHTVERRWDTKRHMPKWSVERRAQFESQPKRTYSPEQRKRMSEHMKEVRRNKYWSSKGKS